MPDITPALQAALVAGQERHAALPLYGLLVGLVLVLVAGVFAFLTNALLLALVLFMIGVVCLGGCGDALRRN